MLFCEVLLARGNIERASAVRTGENFVSARGKFCGLHAASCPTLAAAALDTSALAAAAAAPDTSALAAAALTAAEAAAGRGTIAAAVAAPVATPTRSRRIRLPAQPCRTAELDSPRSVRTDNQEGSSAASASNKSFAE